MSVAYGTGPKGAATRLHAELVRSRGFCQSCLAPRDLQCAHIISRRYNNTRTDEANAFCLCASCHFRFGDHPDEWMGFVDDTIGRVEYTRLKLKALELRKWKDADWRAEVVRLKALLKEAA